MYKDIYYTLDCKKKKKKTGKYNIINTEMIK